MAREAGEQHDGLRITEVALQAIGAIAGLVAWVALVGGALESARLTHAGVASPVRVASSLPRAQLIGEGVAALAAPLVLATALGVIAYLLAEHLGIPSRAELLRHREQMPYDAHRRERAQRRWAVLLAGVALGFAFLAWVLPGNVLRLVMIVFFLGAMSLAIAFRLPTKATAGFATFAAALGISGVIVAVAEYSKDTTRLDRVTVDRREGRSPVAGFYLSGSGGDVQVAVKSDRGTGMSALTIPKDEIETVVIGGAVTIKHGTFPDGDRPPVTRLTPPRDPTIIVGPTTTDTNITIYNPPPQGPGDSGEERAPRIVLSHADVEADAGGLFKLQIGREPETVHMVVKVYAYPREAMRHQPIAEVRRTVLAGGTLDLRGRLRGDALRRLHERGRVATRLAISAAGDTGVSSVRARLIVRRAGS